MKLSVIIPVYNEENSILKILKEVLKVKLNKEIIVVDDFSKDNTRKILSKIKNKNIKIIFQDKNKGKGAAIREGLTYATGNFVIIQDADLEYNPQEFIKLFETAKSKKLKVVYGSRFLENNPYAHISFYIGNMALSLFTSIFYFNRITDMETCYKLIDTKLMKSLYLKSNRFDIEPEITSKILKRGIKIIEVPITYKPRSQKEGKKIKWMDGFSALWALIKYRFVD